MFSRPRLAEGVYSAQESEWAYMSRAARRRAPTVGQRRGQEVAPTIQGQHGGLVEAAREEGAGRMGLVVSDVHHAPRVAPPSEEVALLPHQAEIDVGLRRQALGRGP